MNSVSPVSTPYGSSSGPTRTTTLIDSGVWPGVERTSSDTAPRSMRGPVGHRRDRELDPAGGGRAVDDLGAGAAGQLEVARQEVGVEVRLDHVLDAQLLGRCVVHVLVDVAARVDDDGPARRPVPDQVGGLRQAPEVVLAEEQRARSVVHRHPPCHAPPRVCAPPPARPITAAQTHGGAGACGGRPS